MGLFRRIINRWNLWRVLDMLPIVLPVMLVAFGLATLVLALFGYLHIWSIWTFGPLVAVLAAMPVIKYSNKLPKLESTKERRLVLISMLVFFVAWVGLNTLYASQSLFTGRDSATYVNTALRVINNDDLLSPIQDVFGPDIDNLDTDAPGFESIQQKDLNYSQGSHMFPLILGSVGKLTSESTMLRTVAPAIGGLALLAVFAFARLVLKSRYAALVTVILGLSLPMIYFSRDTYTEPLLIVSIFSAFVVMWLAQSLNKKSLLVLSGLLIGLPSAVRIDGILVTATLLLSFYIYFAVASKNLAIKNANLYIRPALLGAVSVVLVGLADLYWLSRPYFFDHWDRIYPELILLLSVIVLGSLMLRFSNATKLLGSFYSKFSGSVQHIVAWSIVIVSLFLATRPLWLKSYSKTQNSIVEFVQTRTGQLVEPRTYSELSTQWLEWYIGLPIVALGVLGLVLISVRVISKMDLRLAPFLLVFGSMSLLYTLEPNITPDQIWAMRRFLPIVIPGLILLAVYAMAEVFGKFKSQIKQFKSLAAFSMIGLLLVPVILAMQPFITVRESTQLGAIQSICVSLPKNAAIVWVWHAGNALAQPTVEMCGIPAAKLDAAEPSRQELQKIAKNIRDNGYEPYIGVFGSEIEFIAQDYKPGMDSHIVNFEYVKLEQTLQRAPKDTVETKDSLHISHIKQDGSLSKIPIDPRANDLHG